MAISEKQKELDLIKWEKSQLLGNDACGSFNYCVHCNKSIENPCENALNILNGETPATEAKPAKAKTCKTKTAEKTTKKTTTKSTKTASKTTKSTKKSTK